MNGFLRVIAALALIRMVADMLLPSGETAEIVDFGVGLCMALCMLGQMMLLLRGDM